MVCELSVTLQNEESKITKKFLIYEEITVSEDDPIIEECINMTKESFNEEPDNVSVSIKMEVV